MLEPIKTAIEIKVELNYEVEDKNATAKSSTVFSQDF